ncbi:MAG: transporter substrate-binding domain-containing protein [Burkholderiales bacterium]|nr:transporter substrate-binding domain-containing protein [Burkholderiales bacterium]
MGPCAAVVHRFGGKPWHWFGVAHAIGSHAGGGVLARLFIVLGVVLNVPVREGLAQTVSACADRAEMPPFVFKKRVNGQATEEAVGASVEVLAQVLRGSGQRLNVQLLPWARCLMEVDAGHIQIALDVSRDEAQHRNFRLTRAFVRTHAVALYARSRFPNGLDLRSDSAWKALKVCGFGGHRFEHFGLDSNAIDRGTTYGYDQVIVKLNTGRCDAFIDSREVIGGNFLINPGLRSQLTHGMIAVQALPATPPQELFFGVTDNSAASGSLLQLLNRGLDELEQRREIDAAVGRYMQ